MKVSLIKTADGTWMPVTPCKVLDSAGAGEEITAEVKRQRNGKFHRLAWSWLNSVFQNQDRYQTLEQMRVSLTIKAGYIKEHVIEMVNKTIRCSECGHESTIEIEQHHIVPESLSYENMDEDQFRDWQKSFDQVLQGQDINVQIGFH